MQNKTTGVVLVDDHVLLRKGLGRLIDSFGEYAVLFQSGNGKIFTNTLDPDNLPEIVLLDINMPEMDGYETVLWLKENYPLIKVLALSMYDNDTAIIRMLKNGARGYILKDIEPEELKIALDSVRLKGFYYSEMITGKLLYTVNHMDDSANRIKNIAGLNDRELEFLKLSCSEKTYKEIADIMNLSPRTIDGYREDLFEKLSTKTRVGLVMYAIKHGIISL